MTDDLPDCLKPLALPPLPEHPVTTRDLPRVAELTREGYKRAEIEQRLEQLDATYRCLSVPTNYDSDLAPEPLAPAQERERRPEALPMR